MHVDFKFILCLLKGLLIVAGMGMMWFRIYMNYGTSPIFKPEEMRAAFHPNRTVRYK